MNSAPTFTAFISYAKTDKKKAHAIANGLERRGVKCWIAPRDVRPGHEYGDEIMRGIAASRCMVLVMSRAANASTFVRREVERAVSKGKQVLTIRVENVEPKDGLDLFVSSLHWIDAFSGQLSPHVAKLADLLAKPDTREVPRALDEMPIPAPFWRRARSLGSGGPNLRVWSTHSHQCHAVVGIIRPCNPCE